MHGHTHLLLRAAAALAVVSLTFPLVLFPADPSNDDRGDTGICRRAVHASAYDKNLEEQVRPAVVPDDVIGSAVNPDKYWGPHPTTGVFGPLADAKVATGAPATGANGGGSVLDQKVWFRPLEDVEKPPVA